MRVWHNVMSRAKAYERWLIVLACAQKMNTFFHVEICVQSFHLLSRNCDKFCSFSIRFFLSFFFRRIFILARLTCASTSVAFYHGRVEGHSPWRHDFSLCFFVFVFIVCCRDAFKLIERFQNFTLVPLIIAGEDWAKNNPLAYTREK